MTTREQIADHLPTARELLNRAGLDYRRSTGLFAAEVASVFVLGLGIGAAVAFMMMNAGRDPNGDGVKNDEAFGPPVSTPVREPRT